MNELLLLLAQNALLLVAGTTLLLLLGCGGVVLCKSPVHRQRIAELTIAGVLGWIVLALFPLPRLLPLVVSPEGRAANPDTMDAVPSQEIPATAPELLPDVTERAQEETIIEDFEAAGGQVTPFYISSPSEEFSPIAKSPAPGIVVTSRGTTGTAGPRTASPTGSNGTARNVPPVTYTRWPLAT